MATVMERILGSPRVGSNPTGVVWNVGGTHLATLGGTVAILAQGTSWAVAVTQAFLVAVQIPRVWVLGPRGS